MRAAVIYKILFVTFCALVVAPFVILPTISMLICLDITVFNPTLPPTDAMDYILWRKARENLCDWPVDFVPAAILIIVGYSSYKWFFGTTALQHVIKQDEKSTKNTS